jgi:hypothetical protein
VDVSLTDRGLVDLDFLWICGAALSVTLGFAIGRWWALTVPVALTSLIFFGVDRDWWGGGLAEGWAAVFAWSTTVGLALAGLGMVASLGIRRLRRLGPTLRLSVVGAQTSRVERHSWPTETATRPSVPLRADAARRCTERDVSGLARGSRHHRVRRRAGVQGNSRTSPHTRRVQVRRPRAAVTDNSFGPCFPGSP